MKGVIGDCPRKPQTPSDTEKSQLTETKKRTEANLNEASPDYVHDNTVITAQFEGSGPASKKARPLEADDDEEEGYSYTLSFNINFPHDEDTVYLAHCYPYTYRYHAFTVQIQI